jgi:hypothetical protein
MRVRAVDGDNDWLFGKGQNDYVRNLDAVKQNIKTRLLEFLGDCFFNMSAGVDWFNLLGAKDQTALNLAISAVILNTQYVTGLTQLTVEVDAATRALSVSYEVETSYGTSAQAFSLDPTLSA